MADEKIRIVFKADTGQELHSEVLTESLSAWLDNGWELSPDFLSDEEIAEAPAAAVFTYEDWYAAGGRSVIEGEDEAEPEPSPEVVDETAVTESDQSVVETPEEN